MANKNVVDIALDSLGLLMDYRTNSAVNRLNAGATNAKVGTGTTAERATGLFSHIAGELGWGSKDESSYLIEMDKLDNEEEKKEIRNLNRILDKRQLRRIRIITYNAQGEPERTKTIPAKKGADGAMMPEKVIVTSPKQSGGVKFLSALAKLLKEEPNDNAKIALMLKLNYLPTTRSFVEAAEDKVKAVLRKELAIDDSEELTAKLIMERFNEDPTGITARLKAYADKLEAKQPKKEEYHPGLVEWFCLAKLQFVPIPFKDVRVRGPLGWLKRCFQRNPDLRQDFRHKHQSTQRSAK